MTATGVTLEQWLTGIHAGPDSTSSQVVVTQRAELIAPMIRTAAIDGAATIYFQGEMGAVGRVGPPAQLMRLSGSFRANEHLFVDDGFELQNRQYGAAEFACFDMPTVLWIENSDDLSAYLRDADDAWTTGRFAHHVTHPNAIVANLAGVGGPSTHAGPADRLYVAADGAIRTSPTGRVLGATGSSGLELNDGWSRANTTSAYPDASCLPAVFDDADRTEALGERPWIARYLVVAAAIREIRRSYRQPARASGFGGRLSADLPRSDTPDAVSVPVLVRVGSTVQALDPASRVAVELSPASLAVIETLLEPPELVRRWREVPGAGSVPVAIDELARGGVAQDWCARVLRNDPAKTTQQTPPERV